jgi:molybdenum cofactor synthesis domain-containing protein
VKKIRVEQALGTVLCHDITRIVPGEFKGRAFKKGHIITQKDIPELLKLGKEHIFVWEPEPGGIHEEEAALRLANAICGENIEFDEPKEGKSVFRSKIRGFFEVKSELLYKINCVDMVSAATIPGNFAVEEGQKLAGVRVIPLVIQEEKIIQVENICKEHGPAFSVTPYKKLCAGIVTTGSEIYKGRIKDKFGHIIKQKLAYYGADIFGQVYCPDDMEDIKNAIFEFIQKGVKLIIMTGGMSVDPDDLTPGAIKSTGASVVTYGVPVQPGNMFMMAYLEDAVLLGVPGCAMYHGTTILDVVLSRVFSGHTLTRDDFIKMGEGGFCSNCEECCYPRCYFCR